MSGARLGNPCPPLCLEMLKASKCEGRRVEWKRKRRQETESLGSHSISSPRYQRHFLFIGRGPFGAQVHEFVPVGLLDRLSDSLLARRVLPLFAVFIRRRLGSAIPLKLNSSK